MSIAAIAFSKLKQCKTFTDIIETSMPNAIPLCGELIVGKCLMQLCGGENSVVKNAIIPVLLWRFSH